MQTFGIVRMVRFDKNRNIVEVGFPFFAECLHGVEYTVPCGIRGEHFHVHASRRVYPKASIGGHAGNQIEQSGVFHGEDIEIAVGGDLADVGGIGHIAQSFAQLFGRFSGTTVYISRSHSLFL